MASTTPSGPAPEAPRLVLASTSPWRRELLARLGLPFEVRDPCVDETLWRHLPPAEMAPRLAVEKAVAAARGHDGEADLPRASELILGSDQVCTVDGEVLGKPGTAERAHAQLARLSGRTHQLLTAVALHGADPVSGDRRTEVELDTHTLTMRHLSEAEIASYVESDQPLGCAGAYRLEARGLALFERIEADPRFADDSAIVGLPLWLVCLLLRRFGVEPLMPGARPGPSP